MEIRNEILVPDAFYHIYNRGINSGKIFSNQENYLFFLSKFATFLSPLCEVYAYCLLPNHFHFLIKVKSEKEIRTFVSKGNDSNFSFHQEKGLHSYESIVSKQIGKFISSYSQAYNKVNKRHGPLLESPFKRKRIDSEEYLRNLIVYIHLNPVGFNVDFSTYQYSSYKSILSKQKTLLKREETIAFFEDVENFVYLHGSGQPAHLCQSFEL
ncbi:transposase [Flavobacterium sp.]|uniref:transposase n=1 Tax=Flavobacterium sp. TaxID=239 RepID=UPI002614B693|nr:transposase [Flavobacterium sp.]